MQETLHNLLASISIGGRPLWNLCFADDIDLVGAAKQNSSISPPDLKKQQEHTEWK